VLAAGWWSVSTDDAHARQRRLAAATLTIFGMSLTIAAVLLPKWLRAIPDLASAPNLLHLIPTVALIMGVGIVAGGRLLLRKRAALGLAVIGVTLGAADIANVSGFGDFDSVLSSRKLVNSLREKVGPDCIWVSEGSKEIGASAGIAFYLGRDATGRARNVLVMSDDTRRPPPKFPGVPADYLITRTQLAERWGGSTPMLFITDFQRTDWLVDYPHLPPDVAGCETDPLITGNRRVYANAAAWKRMHPELANTH
jgi:hypothetical protein